MMDWIRRAMVTFVYQGSRQKIQAKIMQDEYSDGIDHVQPYGLSVCPVTGSEAVLGFVEGDRTHAVAIVVGDRRYAIGGLASGEVCLHDDTGLKILLSKTGIVISGAGKPVIVDAPSLECTGQVKDATGTMQQIRASI